MVESPRDPAGVEHAARGRPTLRQQRMTAMFGPGPRRWVRPRADATEPIGRSLCDAAPPLYRAGLAGPTSARPR